MSRRLLLYLSLVFLPAWGASARPVSPFGVSAGLRVRDGEPVVRVSFTVPEDHVLYAERLRFETEDGTPVTPLRIPGPNVARDKVSGREKRMYDRSFAADFRLDPAFLTNFVVKFQGCSNSACYF